MHLAIAKGILKKIAVPNRRHKVMPILSISVEARREVDRIHESATDHPLNAENCSKTH
jgi:hypothetical protein